MTNDKKTSRGRFIVLEGTDGSGKSTHAALLRDAMAKATGRRCLLEREPDSRNMIGGLIRAALHGNVSVTPEGMAYLHVADRLEHIAYMLPLLESGTDIVCDRYYVSNMAYNSTGDISVEDVYRLNAPCARRLQPDLVIFLDVSPEETARRRAGERADSEIYDALERQKKIRENYYAALDLVEREGVKVIRIDASRPKEEVAADVRAAAGI
ncbi:MAG: dTMP kinase [Clostridia bacterium]|nr:dTMP kinase [Clostridia bacterium]